MAGIGAAAGAGVSAMISRHDLWRAVAGPRWIFFLLGGLFNLGGGGFELVSSCYHVAVDARASGTVIDVSGSEGETVRVRFIAQSGEPTEFTVHVDSQYDLGETATVLYSPENPTKASIYSFHRLWLAFGVLLVGLILSLSGILEIRDRLRGIYE